MTMQETFLTRAAVAARDGGHVFPEHAACEAALESAWGRSKLAIEANNLFGQKQSHPPVGAGFDLPTKEYLHGAWLWVPATWARFAGWTECFQARMTLLRRLGDAYPAYAAALRAPDGDSFVELVSQRWSTDPERGEKVLQVWHMHHAVIADALLQA